MEAGQRRDRKWGWGGRKIIGQQKVSVTLVVRQSLRILITTAAPGSRASTDTPYTPRKLFYP